MCFNPLICTKVKHFPLSEMALREKYALQVKFAN